MSKSKVQRKKELNIKLEINTQFDLKNVMHYKSAPAPCTPALFQPNQLKERLEFIEGVGYFVFLPMTRQRFLSLAPIFSNCHFQRKSCKSYYKDTTSLRPLSLGDRLQRFRTSKFC